MIRRPPRSTRTDTLFPYTTVFRSSHVEVPRDDLEAEYSGLACFVQPLYRLEGRSRDTRLKSRSKHWFWSAMLGNWRLYRDAIGAALLINIFALVMPLYTMNVYDRVIPSNEFERSEERRVGHGCVSTCRCRLSLDN